MSKNPVMSNVNIETTQSWFQAASMLWVTAITVSWADLPVTPPYCVDRSKWYLAARYERRLAWTLSKVFPSTSSSCISLYDLGLE